MKTIHMGLNTEPEWLKSAEAIKRWEAEGNEEMVMRWKSMHTISTSLRDQIISEVEENGQCRLSWGCTGRSRHLMHANQWKQAMPEYEFIIGDNYQCLVRKRS